jgi:hypothetical protein
LFLSACPKYLSVNPPPYEDHQMLEAYVASPPQDATARHVELFLADVVAVKEVQSVRNLLKLYTSIDAEKLSAFVGEEAGEEEVLQQLMALKAASRSYQGKQGGSLLDGERASINNLDFTIDGVSNSSYKLMTDHGPRRRDHHQPSPRWLPYPKHRARTTGTQRGPCRSFANNRSATGREAATERWSARRSGTAWTEAKWTRREASCVAI